MDEQLLPAIQKAYDLNLWLLGRVAKLPRDFKFTLGDRPQTAGLDLNLALIEAAHSQRQERSLFRASRLLDQLRVLLRMTRDVGALSARQHEFVSGLNEELGRMIGGWIRSAKRPGVTGGAAASLGRVEGLNHG